MNQIAREYFQHLLYDALKTRRVELDSLSIEYILGIMTNFMNHVSSGEGIPVLAWLYRDAMESTGEKRFLALKKLGDMTLLLSGFFSGYVKQTINGLGYYIDMGCAAYSAAAVVSPNVHPIMTELSQKFSPVVGVLNCVSSRTSLAATQDLDQLLDLYVRDRNNAALGLLIVGTNQQLAALKKYS